MAAWKFACKTLQGMDLDLKLVSREGLQLRLTRAVSGAGSISPTQLMGLGGVLEPVQELQLLDAVEHLGDHRVLVPVILRNAGVRTGYSMHQLGVYAEDPDLGEILYMVMQTEGEEEIPSSTEMPDFKLEWYINVAVGNTDKLEVVIDETGVLTVEQADARYVFLKDYSETVGRLEDAIDEAKEQAAEALDSHVQDTNNPHKLKAEQLGLDPTSDMDKPVSTAQQAALDALKKLLIDTIKSHTDDVDNPHRATKAQVGLGNADNTSDANKPVSIAQQAALDDLYQQLVAYTNQKIATLINGAPESLDTLKEVADTIAAHKTVMDALDAAIGKKANAAEFDSHAKDSMKHITAAERTNWNDANGKKHAHNNKSVLDGITSALISGWNAKMETTGDSANNTVAFSSGDAASPTGWADIGVVASGEKHSSLFRKMSLAIKNMRYLYKMLGATDISAIGGGTVTGAINALNTGLEPKELTVNMSTTYTNSDTTAVRAIKSGKVISFSGRITTARQTSSGSTVRVGVISGTTLCTDFTVGANATATVEPIMSVKTNGEIYLNTDNLPVGTNVRFNACLITAFN